MRSFDGSLDIAKCKNSQMGRLGGCSRLEVLVKIDGLIDTMVILKDTLIETMEIVMALAVVIAIVDDMMVMMIHIGCVVVTLMILLTQAVNSSTYT